MSQTIHRRTALLMVVCVLLTGCHPQQPIFFGEDGDLSHYIDHALAIENPDVESGTIEEVAASKAPLTLDNARFDEPWDLTLNEAVQHALANSKVLRQLGGTFISRGDPTSPNTGITPSLLLDNPNGAVTIYRPALIELAFSEGFV